MNPEQVKTNFIEYLKKFTQVMQFGKHKGRPISDVALEDPRYLNYMYDKIIHNEDETQKDNKFNKEFIDLYKKIAKNSVLVPYGKYKALPLSYVKDPDYLKYIMNNHDNLGTLDPYFHECLVNRFATK